MIRELQVYLLLFLAYGIGYAAEDECSDCRQRDHKDPESERHFHRSVKSTESDRVRNKEPENEQNFKNKQ